VAVGDVCVGRVGSLILIWGLAVGSGGRELVSDMTAPFRRLPELQGTLVVLCPCGDSNRKKLLMLFITAKQVASYNGVLDCALCI
jgi:hypothetical protein